MAKSRRRQAIVLAPGAERSYPMGRISTPGIAQWFLENPPGPAIGGTPVGEGLG
ncbi:MAG TPA: hypothetical protein VHP33_25210 [Polyangiaceae bacterium]|nr:hypothetical protein [Polyangiaceae bacterium]